MWTFATLPGRWRPPNWLLSLFEATYRLLLRQYPLDQRMKIGVAGFRVRSRVLHTLTEAGLVTVKGRRIVIHDIERLCHFEQ